VQPDTLLKIAAATMSQPRVALVGASGNLGSAVLEKLVEANLPLSVISRQGSSSKIPEAIRGKITQREVDYTSASSLKEALTGIDVIISTLGWNQQFEIQKALIDAGAAVGVKRFIPSEFGNDTRNPRVREFPAFFAEKTQTQEYLFEKVKENPELSYTFVYTNTFLDWQMKLGLLADFKNHKATLYDGGDRPFSATRLATIGKTLVAIVNKLDQTKDQDIYIHDLVLTQNHLIEIAKGIDVAEWETIVVSTEEGEAQAREGIAEGDVMGPSLALIARAAYAEGYGGDFSSKLSNASLGLPEMSEDDLKVLVRECM
jgi:putative NADH-flavin reductase